MVRSCIVGLPYTRPRQPAGCMAFHSLVLGAVLSYTSWKQMKIKHSTLLITQSYNHSQLFSHPVALHKHYSILHTGALFINIYFPQRAYFPHFKKTCIFFPQRTIFSSLINIAFCSRSLFSSLVLISKNVSSVTGYNN